MASWHGQEMSVELDELCEWCFESGRERPATSMLAGVPLCESCSTGKQTRFTEKKVELYATEPAATSPGRSIPVPKKVDVPQVEKIIIHEPEPEKKPAPSLVEKIRYHDQEISDRKPEKPVSKWEQCFKEIAGIKVGERITVKMPEGGNRNQMNSALGMNALTSKWRWSLQAHHDKTVTVKKIGDWATKDAERLDSEETPRPKLKPAKKVKLPKPEPQDVLTIPLNRKPVVLVPGAQPITQVGITPNIARAVWESLTLAQKAELWDIESMWNDADDWLRMVLVSKVLLVEKEEPTTSK